MMTSTSKSRFRPIANDTAKNVSKLKGGNG